MKPNQDMNVDAFEDSAVQSSNTAKRVALGAGLLAGGAAIGGSAVYAANAQEVQTEEVLTIDDVKETANVAGETTEPANNITVTQTVQQAPEPEQELEPEIEPEPEPEVTWDETENVYVNGELIVSIEKGTIEGHDFLLADTDGNGEAEFLAVDVDDNGQYSEDEVVLFNDSDHVQMGHETAHTTDNNIISADSMFDGTSEEVAHNEPIYNDFSENKVGEEFDGDFAENNPDYNNEADTDDYSVDNDENYLAENDSYDSEYMGGEDCLA